MKGGKKKRLEEIIEVDLEQEVFKCEQCDYTSTRKVPLEAHKRVKHN